MRITVTCNYTLTPLKKTTVQVFPPEYMGVVASPPPPYIPADISVIGFLQ